MPAALLRVLLSSPSQLNPTLLVAFPFPASCTTDTDHNEMPCANQLRGLFQLDLSSLGCAAEHNLSEGSQLRKMGRMVILCKPRALV